MKKNDSNILTTTDVAKLCSVDSSTVLNWINQGKLKGYQTLGGHHRILQDDLWIFIKENGLPFLGEFPRPDSTKKKILIVDDDPDFLQQLQVGLSNESDWLIEKADSSLDAGLKVGSWQPDLIIMDVKMPGLDGLDFCRFLKKTLQSEKLPVIVVTGFPKESQEKKEVFELGIFDYLEKPFLPKVLVEKIRQFFKASKDVSKKSEVVQS